MIYIQGVQTFHRTFYSQYDNRNRRVYDFIFYFSIKRFIEMSFFLVFYNIYEKKIEFHIEIHLLKDHIEKNLTCPKRRLMHLSFHPQNL